MYDNESYLRSFDADMECVDRELQQLKERWKNAGNVGNLPIPTLLDLAHRHPKRAKPKGRPKGAKNKPKPELVTSDG